MPLSREFLLARGYCCNLGCVNCPYKVKDMNIDGYGIDYTVEITHDHQPLDIINAINQALFDAGAGYQFILEEEEQDDNIPSLFYSLVVTNDLAEDE